MLAETRSRLRHASPLTLFAFLSLLALALGGCGALRFGAAPTPTPDAATILQRVTKASYRDATFSLTVTSSGLLGTTSNSTGSGAITTSPARTHITISSPFDLPIPTPSTTPSTAPSATPSATPGPSQITIEIITDTATNTTYTRITGLPAIGGVPLSDGSWIKTTISGDVS